MGFKKDYKTARETVGDYHTCKDKVLYRGRKKRVTIHLETFLDRETYLRESSAMDKRIFVAKGKDFDNYFSTTKLNGAGKNLLARCYEFLKTQSEIDGYEDVLEA